jgi:hypothetical protein
MRISRFCEARGWYEADNSIESKIFCFGSDGPSGDSSSTAASEDIGTKDVDKGPKGQDTSSDRQAYSDRFGGTSTRNFNIDRSQGFVDTEKGRVYGSPETLSAGMASGDITPSGDRATADFTAGLAAPEPSIADFDTTNVPEFDEPAGAISLYDIPGVTPPGSYAPTPVTAAAKGPALGTTDYEFDALGGASRAAVPGPAALSPEQDARLSAMLAAEGVPLPGPTTEAQAAGRQQARDAYRAGMGEGLIEDLDVFDVDALGPVDLDEVPAGALPAGTPAGSPMQQITRQATDPVGTYTGAGSLQYSPSSGALAATDILGAYDDIFGSTAPNVGPISMDQVRADEINLERQQYEDYINTGQVDRELAPNEVVSFEDFGGKELSRFKPGKTAAERANQIANFSYNKDPRIASAAQQAVANTVGTQATELDQRARDQQQRAAAAAAVAAEGLPTGLPPVDLDEVPGGAVNPYAQMEREVAQGLGARTAAPGPTGIETTEVPGFEPTNYGPADLAEAQRNLERAQASTPNEFGFRTGLPTTFGDTGIPTGIGMLEGAANALLNPEASVANAISRYGIKSVDGASAEGSANYNPNGLEVVTSGGPIGEGGRTVAYDARGNVVYDSRGIGSQFGDLLTGNRPPKNIQDLYDRQRAIADAERDRQGGGDGGGQPIVPPPEEVVVPPEEYQGQAIPGGQAYQPMGPISYAYTGLPSLAPQRLRPSFQARGQYAPLFPMGNYRRS